MPDQKRILATILMKAALPLVRALVEEKPSLSGRYRKWKKAIQFRILCDPDLVSHLQFSDGDIRFVEGRHPSPAIEFVFKNYDDFIALMTGKPALPRIKGMVKNGGTLIMFLPLMLGLTLLMPNKLPQDQAGKALKVKLLLYFLSVALSQMNRAGDEDMRNFAKDMPDRIFQWSVGADGPAAYLRIKKGRSKAGKGLYAKRKPFVHMKFASIDSAFKVLTGQIDNVEAMKSGDLVVDGSPEYGKNISAIMKKIESMIS